MRRRDLLAAGMAALVLPSCSSARRIERDGDLEFLDPAAPDLFRSNRLETLTDGFTWSEGPAWDRARDCLYFTDVPENTAYRWSRREGLEVFLAPSGAPADAVAGMREPGANGLWFADDGQLYLCNHGRRAIQRLDPDTGVRETLVDRFEGHRFNSPNDLVRLTDGTIFFTDPPYGLEGLDASPLKELSSNGVYRLDPDGRCERVDDGLSFPNGIAVSPDERWLYVAQSDPQAPHIFRYRLGTGRRPVEREIWHDASAALARGETGLPDGMCISSDGHVFATGPGGVLVLAPDGVLRARILTGRATANCAFGEDGRVLYMTAHDRLLRLPLNVRGLQWS